MQNKIADIARLKHIINAINEIESYVSNTDFTEFSHFSMMIYACIKQLEIIGEAANHLSEELKQLNPSIHWSQIIGMRNVYVHEYFGVDIGIVWDIIKNDLPTFKDKILNISR